MRRPHAYTRATLEAAELFGLEMARARREQRFTAAELAERVGIGDPSVGIGIAFETATLLGVPLFGAERKELPGLLARSRDRLALLPARVRQPPEVDNAF
jgi:hypothetical protein